MPGKTFCSGFRLQRPFSDIHRHEDFGLRVGRFPKSQRRSCYGGIWLGAIEGIYHIYGKVFEKFGIEDCETGIWVATAGGLDYFHRWKGN
jgi:hypothetical protein